MGHLAERSRADRERVARPIVAARFACPPTALRAPKRGAVMEQWPPRFGGHVKACVHCRCRKPGLGLLSKRQRCAGVAG